MEAIRGLHTQFLRLSREDQSGAWQEAWYMHRLFLKLGIMIVVCGLLYSTPAATQVSPTTKKAARVRITQGPEMERVDPDFAIIRWTSNNPGGSPEHYGVVHYGTNPKELNQTATTPNRLNRSHPDMIFRVRLPDLKPKTTYYYTVDSTQATGKSDGVKSPIRHFSTP